MNETIEDTAGALGGAAPAVPGLVFVFSGDQPCFRVVRMPGRSFIIGRDVDGWRLPDERVSREHATVSFDGTRWSVRDLGSKNGVFVDGERQEQHLGMLRVLRVGHTLAGATALSATVAGISRPIDRREADPARISAGMRVEFL